MKLIQNPGYTDNTAWVGDEAAIIRRIQEREMLPLHQALPGYAKTPLLRLEALSAQLQVGGILVKDESKRYTINSFKGLGAGFAIFSLIREAWQEKTGSDLSAADFVGNSETIAATLGRMTFAAATDGNHGRAVAWTAKMLGQEAVIFMPDDTVASRIANIEKEGATVRIIEGSFDDCVAACDREAGEKGWHVLADTAYGDYLEIPKHIVVGYSTIFAESTGQLGEESGEETIPDTVFVPAGVGGLAAAAVAFYAGECGAKAPRIVCVEPESCACFFESIAGGKMQAATGSQDSIMAGLNCGIPSLVAWPFARQGIEYFMTIEDEWAREAMREYYRQGIESGESGAATLAGLLALHDLAVSDAKSAEAKQARSILAPGSRILLVNTEGATDPEHYQQVVGKKPGEG